MNEVIETEEFAKIIEGCELIEQRWIEKMKDQLTSNLFVGKPLSFNWFREKKFRNKRLFYLVNNQMNKALLISFAPKKKQREVIRYILANKKRYLNQLSDSSDPSSFKVL